MEFAFQIDGYLIGMKPFLAAYQRVWIFLRVQVKSGYQLSCFQGNVEILKLRQLFYLGLISNQVIEVELLSGVKLNRYESDFRYVHIRSNSLDMTNYISYAASVIGRQPVADFHNLSGFRYIKQNDMVANLGHGCF